MTLTPENRMAAPAKRKQGRPPNSVERPPASEAETVILPDAVMPCVCKMCGRGMQPRVLRTQPNGVRICSCKLCGKEFEYTPARIRPL